MSKQEKMLSPVGEVKFVSLDKPDTKLAKSEDEGKYRVSLVLDPKDAGHKKFLAKLKKLAEEKHPKGRKPYKEDKDRDGVETGKILVSFQSTYKPKVFDKYGQDIPEDVVVGNGSVCQMCFVPAYYEVTVNKGMTLYIQAVKVIELVEFGGRTAEDFGFDVEEAPEDAGFEGVEEGDDEGFDEDHF